MTTGYQPIETLDVAAWNPSIAPAEQASAIARLEAGSVLHCPHLAFAITDAERAVLERIKGKGKSATMVPGDSAPRGLVPSSSEAEAVRAVLERFARQSAALIGAVFPAYRDVLIPGRMSYRPAEIADRTVAQNRYDDRLLHVDAFPRQPTRGARILRVFSNVNFHGEPRIWRVGEPFEAAARHFAPQMKVAFPGYHSLRGLIRQPHRRRTDYDHLMLQLHDRLKHDAEYQKNAPATKVAFAANTSWIVFTDQVLHSALGGRQALEKTFYIPVAAQSRPETSPLRVLERITGRRLARADGRDVSAVRHGRLDSEEVARASDLESDAA